MFFACHISVTLLSTFLLTVSLSKALWMVEHTGTSLVSIHFTNKNSCCLIHHIEPLGLWEVSAFWLIGEHSCTSPGKYHRQQNPLAYKCLKSFGLVLKLSILIAPPLVWWIHEAADYIKRETLPWHEAAFPRVDVEVTGVPIAGVSKHKQLHALLDWLWLCVLPKCNFGFRGRHCFIKENMLLCLPHWLAFKL